MEHNLGKATGWLAGAAVIPLFVLAISLAALNAGGPAHPTPLYLMVAWGLFFSAAALCIGLGLGYLSLLCRRHARPFVVYNDVRCVYMRNAQQLTVTCWFDDVSMAPWDIRRISRSCTVRVGINSVALDKHTQVGGSYVDGRGIVAPQTNKVMVEFWEQGVSLDDPKQAWVTITLGWPNKMWRTVVWSKKVSVQVN